MPGRAARANDAWEALLGAHQTLMRRFAASGVWEGLTMREYDVLYTLSKRAEPVRPGELHRHVLLSQPALSRMVDRLADRGLVCRTTDPGDGRGVLLSLSAAGAELQHAVGRRHALDVADAVGSRISPAEMEQLQAVCEKLAGGGAAERMSAGGGATGTRSGAPSPSGRR